MVLSMSSRTMEWLRDEASFISVEPTWRRPSPIFSSSWKREEDENSLTPFANLDFVALGHGQHGQVSNEHTLLEALVDLHLA
jgi:hypothetical protein